MMVNTIVDKSTTQQADLRTKRTTHFVSSALGYLGKYILDEDKVDEYIHQNKSHLYHMIIEQIIRHLNLPNKTKTREILRSLIFNNDDNDDESIRIKSFCRLVKQLGFNIIEKGVNSEHS